MGERILVIQREALPAGLPRKGFWTCPEKAALDSMRTYRFLDRTPAEKDPSFKQIIPYIVLRCGNSVFRYWRTKKAGESRLHHLYSIGVGGHINERDVNLFSSSVDEILKEAAMRELREEVVVPTGSRPHFEGLLNDDETEVGQVHLGMVFSCEVDWVKVAIRETGALARGEWIQSHELPDGVDYETWSEILIRDWLLADRSEDGFEPAPPGPKMAQ